ncbi:class I mannose-6-phosphate isomerase [Algoriphagus sp. AGSA1]|uniref:class I mannose-6-phosphate isomerase n=1 Tax=Algoriphagus sp. AGSA1 TaxID=2907213 RepID=UPI001F1D83BA|nr:class I mannose-6-phosphate isomerase [Algoriphagus sp. AGSA1]MCE7055250.1 class I mannose-6-phosphate isomerase [Algoriphagus sp. AGSA1]
MNRLSNQPQVPIQKQKKDSGSYDIFPAFELQPGKIKTGYEDLFDMLGTSDKIILDGYVGVDWSEISAAISEYLAQRGMEFRLINCADYYKSADEIEKLTAPFLGGDDPVFGKKTDLVLQDYFRSSFFSEVDQSGHLTTIVYGCGASLCGIEGRLVYFDLPKNELQYRMRAGSITNLAIDEAKEPKQAYKHFFFVDWLICNKEKKRLLAQIDIIVDQQRSNSPSWMSGEVLRVGLDAMSESYFRVRPWFEPGVWGGQWLSKNIPDLPQNEPNYAWSFEMIVPENGLIFSSSGMLLEASFDWLMYRAGDKVLGKAYNRFGDDFPIRFDFLDTFGGDNLSVQCHPTTVYAKEHFGENFTQDETYYILDTTPESHVYLGFQENIDPKEFRQELENSVVSQSTINVERFVQKLPSEKHGLYLIPNGTIHCSGTDNLVLEISATPYIYTFKIYDWQRLDLNGEPRPLNVDRAFENLDFSRKGQVVQDTLISKPEVLETGDDWEKILLPTHSDHFYEVVRYEFDSEVIISTTGQCHLLMLVEGESLELHTSGGGNVKFHFAETFAVPAATGSYRLKNLGSMRAQVAIAYVKDSAC